MRRIRLRAGGDVAPLVGAAQLDFAVHRLVEVQEVVALNQLVGEFGERHAVALAVEAFLHGVFGHHVVDGDALADVADEIEEREFLHPVVVVDQRGGVRGVGVEVEQFGQLAFDRLLIVTQGLSSSRLRSCDLPRSPIMPVAPPTRASGRWPHIWKCLRIITPTRWPICSESAVGSMPR